MQAARFYNGGHLNYFEKKSAERQFKMMDRDRSGHLDAYEAHAAQARMHQPRYY